MQKCHLTYFKKIKGNTLMEVMIAMVVLTVCITIASLIYQNIQRGTKAIFKLKALTIGEAVLGRVSKSNQMPEPLLIDGFYVTSKISTSEISTDINEINVTVFDSERRKLIQLIRLIEK